MSNTIQDKLAYLEETKGLIKEAIIAKGGTVSDEDTFRSYVDKISSIQSGGSIAGAPSGMKFVNSTFTTVPTEIIPYLEQQTDLSGIFENCKSLTTVPSFDASKCTNTNKMFYNCGLLQTVSQINTPNVTNMNQMFYYCKKLQTVPLFDTSSVTDIGGMFIGCESLTTVPSFDTSNVIDMENMFNGCLSLQTVSQFNTSNVTDMHNMFGNCMSLQTVPQFDTSKVNNMSWMFGECKKLQTVPQFDTSNVDSMSYIFYDCTSLTNLGGFTGLKQDLELGYCPLLTLDSVVNVINAAADMTSSPKTLTLKQSVFDKLSQEQIATATAKGWNIAQW